jgi:hypothetical protein
MQNNPAFSYSRIIRKAVNRPYDTYDKYGDQNNDWRRGHLTKVEHYTNGMPVSSTEYHYDYRPNGNQFQVWVYKPYCTVVYIADPTVEWNFHDPNEWPIFTGDPDYPNNIIDNSTYINGSWQMDVFNWKALESETSKQFFYNNGTFDTVTIVKNYQYSDYEHTNPTGITSANFNQTIEDKYDYLTGMVNTLSYHKKTVNNSVLESKIVFANSRPQKVQYKTSNMNAFEDKIVYDRYDYYGNTAEISTNDGKHTCYIWSYGNQYPVAQIDHITYSGLLQALGKDTVWIKELGNKYAPSEQDMNLLNGLRSKLPTSQVSTFTYKPLLGVSSITDASGSTVYYEQDNFGRLTEISLVKDGQKKKLQTNEYHTNNEINAVGAGFIIKGFNVEEGSIMQAGVEYLFKVYVYGGSGNFTYEWDLFCGEEFCDIWIGEICNDPHNTNYCEIHYEEPNNTMSEIRMTPNTTSKYKGTCNGTCNINKLKIWVTDNLTGKKKIFQTWFYVQ